MACLLLAPALWAATPLASSGSAVAGRMESVLAKRLAGVPIGVVVQDLDSGRILFSRNADRPLLPASNQKVVTTAAALSLLGLDATLSTSLYERGTLDAQGALRGDLIVKGGGDPNFSGRFFDGDITQALRHFAAAAKERGIRSVTGALIVDGTVFDREFVHPSWPRDQLDRWYCAPVGGLCLNDGCVDVLVEPGRAGGAARVADDPGGWLRIEADVKTMPAGKGKSNELQITRLPGNQLKVSGWIRAGSPTFRGFITVEEPVRYFAVILRRAFEEAGIHIERGVEVSETPIEVGPLLHLAVIKSPLAQIVEVTNTNSQNLYAECLLKTLGARLEGEGSWAGGARATERYLQKFGKLAAPFVIADGSGLSRDNRVTARGMVAILADMRNSPAADTFLASLAVSGADSGSLRKRMRGKPEKGRIAAKTGHIENVNALSGYVLDSQGRPRLAFSMIANDFLKQRVWSGTVGNAMDDMCRALVATVDGK